MTEDLTEKATDYLYVKLTGIDNAMERMDDRMSSIEGFFDYLQKRIAELQEDKPQSDAQWTEERLRALEDRVKSLEYAIDVPNVRVETLSSTQNILVDKYTLILQKFRHLEDMNKLHCDALARIEGLLYVR